MGLVKLYRPFTHSAAAMHNLNAEVARLKVASHGVLSRAHLLRIAKQRKRVREALEAYEVAFLRDIKDMRE
jgi:hypothetical protein